MVDLKDIISNYQPDHILVTSQFDQHPDHEAAFLYVQAVLQSLNIPNYFPQVHSSIVHDPAIVWPNPIDPTAYFAEITNSATISNNQLIWSKRESLDVPLAMQSTNYTSNPKYLAIQSEVTQGGAGGEFGSDSSTRMRFAGHKTSWGHTQPPIVNAGIDQTVTAGDAGDAKRFGQFGP